MPSSSGFIRLPLLIAIVFGIGFAASAFLNFQQHQHAEADKKLMQGEITDLRYQIQQDQLAKTPSEPSPSASPDAGASPAPSVSPSPTPSPAVAGASTTEKTATMKAAANVRKGPSSTSDKIISMLPKGTVVTVGSDAQGGYQQITVNGQTGYVLASYLQY